MYGCVDLSNTSVMSSNTTIACWSTTLTSMELFYLARMLYQNPHEGSAILPRPYATSSLFRSALERKYLEACAINMFCPPRELFGLPGQVQRRVAGVQPGAPGLPCHFWLVRAENISGVGQGAEVRAELLHTGSHGSIAICAFEDFLSDLRSLPVSSCCDDLKFQMSSVTRHSILSRYHFALKLWCPVAPAV